MGFRINTNIAALNAQRHLSNISGKLDKSLERLSSGLRINKSSDDASGMATSVYLRGQIGGLFQAARNANDAISMTQTAEGALDVTTNILLRLRELAVQAATDTTNRELLIGEADQLVAELTRIATDTEFVGNTLLNGTFTSGKIQVGANQGQTINFSIGDVRAAALGERATAESTSLGTGGFTVGEFTINAKNVAATQESDDQVSVLDLVGSTRVRNFAVVSFVEGTGNKAVSRGNIGANLVRMTNGTDVVSMGAISAAATIGSVVAWIAAESLTGVSARSDGTKLEIAVSSGYDFGIWVNSAGTASNINGQLLISAVVGTSGRWKVQINDGGTAKVSGLVLNGETVGTVDLRQGASIVSALGTSNAGLLASLAAISNSDAAFVNAMAAAINITTDDSDVKARAGSATTAVKTMVMTGIKGKNIIFGSIAGMSDVNTVGSFRNALGLASTFYATNAEVTTYNGETGAIAKVAAIDAIKSSTKVDALIVATSVTGTAAIEGNTNLVAGDFYINGIDIGAVTVSDGDSTGALISAINAKSTATGVSATLGASNQLVLGAGDGRNISVVTTANGLAVTLLSTAVNRGGVKLNSAENLTISGAATDLGIATGTFTTSLDNAVSLIDLSTQVGADDALATLDAAITQVNKIRSGLGAIQSRISLTIISLTTAAENLSASDSRIKDVDFAEETSIFTKNSILTQAATAILAQANQLPQLALQLLG